MSWGDPFRQAWKDATPAAQAAARESVRSADRAAGSLADSILHALQLSQFAAQDLERLRHAAGRPADPGPAPDMMPLRRAMDEIRNGRVAPDKAEKHLRQALRSVSQEVREASSSARSGTSAGDRDEESKALERLHGLRCALLRQCAEMRDRLAEGAGTDEATAVRLAHVVRLTRACHRLYDLFLNDKHANDPAVPLPPSLPREEASDAQRRKTD